LLCFFTLLLYINTERKWSYPIKPTGGIYSPNVVVFRDNSYNLLKPKDHFIANFVAVPAIRNPKLIKGKLTNEDVNLTKEKIRTIFRIAYEKKHDSLILGAIGCGAFSNPPEHIAQLFKEIIAEKEFTGLFKLIAFAIIDNSRTNNLGD
jgi:uncharacterized protein (TIGR02452 family)